MPASWEACPLRLRARATLQGTSAENFDLSKQQKSDLVNIGLVANHVEG